MKYYAVTDDPNELLHYGRLGMKWGQHIFVGPKSLSYKKALGKLRSSAQKTVKSAKAAVQKSKTQRAINKQQKQQEKFNKAVAKAQKRIAVTENLSRLDALRRFEKADERAAKNEAFMLKTEAKKERIANRQERKYAKNERKMEKYMQEAREGRLRYGKLSEEQVGRIRDRLAFENAARAMGGREQASYRQRRREAIREGKLEGYKKGTAAAMTAVAVGLVQNKFNNKRILDKQNRNEAQRQKEATRIKNKRSTKEIKQDLKQEAREAEIREGVGFWNRSKTAGQAAEALKRIDDSTHEQKRLQETETKRRNDIDARWQQYLDEGGSDVAYKDRAKLSPLRRIKGDKKKESLGEDTKMDSKELYAKRQKLLTDKGYSTEDIQERKNEAKRTAESESKKRNDIDERYAKYRENGGDEVVTIKDKVGRVETYDISSNGTLAKTDPKKLYEVRSQVLSNQEKSEKQAEENKEKNAYDAWRLKETNERERAAHEKALDDCEKRYERKLKAWRDNGQRGTKPRYVDYVNTAEIAKAYRKPDDIPEYEQAKIYSTLGLPSPITSSNNNQGKKKQNNGNRK